MTADLPTMTCPRCGAEHTDHDGFGFIAHTKPAYADGCGWCSHPSRDGDGKGGMVCGICGDVATDGDFGLLVTLREQVAEFHKAMGVPVDAERPTIIPDARVRLRAALIAEEFAETMAALLKIDAQWLHGQLRHMVESAPVCVDMVELADGLADLDYVVEGTRLEFGIDGAPIAAEVHRSNMAKFCGDVAPNGKRLKPPGWTPPDIAGELRTQGWSE